jgi:hypothetical protein
MWEVSNNQMRKAEDDKLAKRYLLGELSEQELAKLEEQYFADDEAFERLGAAEDDLLDAYALNQLSAADRKRFERRLLLSSAQRERVRFARTLLRTASSTQQIESNIPPLTPTASWWISPFTFLRTLKPVISLSAAAALILAVLAGWWLIHRSNVTQEQQAQQTNAPRLEPGNQAPNENKQQTAQLPSPTQPKQQQPKQQPVTPPTSIRIVTFALVEGGLRDLGDSNHLAIPGDAAVVRLDLTIQRNDYRTYRATLRKTEGELVWQSSGINVKSRSAGKATVALQLRASILRNGDYILTLSGTASGRTEVVGEYSFRVTRN